MGVDLLRISGDNRHWINLSQESLGSLSEDCPRYPLKSTHTLRQFDKLQQSDNVHRASLHVRSDEIVRRECLSVEGDQPILS